jgi:hypothetical protein
MIRKLKIIKSVVGSENDHISMVNFVDLDAINKKVYLIDLNKSLLERIYSDVEALEVDKNMQKMTFFQFQLDMDTIQVDCPRP